jgi:hypothetical protein
VPARYDDLVPYVGRTLGLTEPELEEAFRPAREADVPGILALRRAVSRDVWWNDEAFIRWRYFARPTATGEASYWVFVREGRALGACGVEPVTLVVDGTAMSAVRTLDIMVSPELDGRGLGAYMNLVLFRHFPIVLVTGSNDRSHALLTRMFQHVTDLQVWKSPVRARFSVGARRPAGPLGAAVCLPIDLCLAAGRALRRARLPSGGDLQPIERFDDSATELSRRCEVADRVVVRRDRDYLNWRFIENPRCRYRVTGVYGSGRLEGYVVTRLNLERPNPRRMGEIVDWLAAPDVSATVMPGLMQAGVEALARDGAGIVTVAASTGAAAAFPGFRFRPGERIPFFVRAADPDLHARLNREDRWFVTRGDLDVE